MKEQQKTQEVRMTVKGMTCTGCEDHVVRALEGAGAQEVKADFRRSEASFLAPAGVKLETFSRAVTEAGYTPAGVKTGGHAPVGNPANPSAPDRTAAGQAATDYDLAIIGSGGAAFSAAIQARRAEARVLMVERGTIGGTCVNIGCVPSKTLLRAAKIYDQSRNHPFAGIHTGAFDVDLGRLVGQKDGLVETLRRSKYEELIKEYGLDLIRGEAAFTGEGSIRAGDRTVTAKAFLIATGASPAVPEIPGLRDVEYLTSTSALSLKRLPESLAVIGSGYIALEIGQLFRHLGAAVTLMQRSPKLLKRYDPEVGEAMEGVLRRQGINVLTGVRYEEVEATPRGVRVTVELDGQRRAVEAERLLVAAGRRPNTETLALDRAGVKLGSQGQVIVDEHLRTTNPRIYAAGDVTLGPQFVFVAAYEGAVAADNALGRAWRSLDLSVVPEVIFTSPAVASVGLTEDEARAAGHEVKVSRLPLDAVPRALVDSETAGLFKLVAEASSGRLLGAHIVAENAGDVIYAATLALKFGLTIQDLKETLCPYLTMAEGLKLAALTFDSDVSKLSCCAG